MNTTDKKNDEVFIDRKGGSMYLMVNGKAYLPKGMTFDPELAGHMKSIRFKDVDRDAHEKYMSDLTDKIVKHVDKKAVVLSALQALPPRQLEKLERKMKKHKKPKQVRGCYGLKFGDYEFNIVP
jgi:hypothetical protein